MDSGNDIQINEKTSSPITTIVLVTCFVSALAAVILVSIYVRRKCARGGDPGDGPIEYYEDDDDGEVDGGSRGDAAVLDDGALERFPKLLYSQAKLGKGDSCSVCLADYRESDLLRLLPDCGHVFHLKCVDSWLRMRATCPLCRTLPNSENAAASAAAKVPYGGDGADTIV